MSGRPSAEASISTVTPPGRRCSSLAAIEQGRNDVDLAHADRRRQRRRTACSGVLRIGTARQQQVGHGQVATTGRTQHAVQPCASTASTANPRSIRRRTASTSPAIAAAGRSASRRVRRGSGHPPVQPVGQVTATDRQRHAQWRLTVGGTCFRRGTVLHQQLQRAFAGQGGGQMQCGHAMAVARFAIDTGLSRACCRRSQPGVPPATAVGHRPAKRRTDRRHAPAIPAPVVPGRGRPGRAVRRRPGSVPAHRARPATSRRCSMTCSRPRRCRATAARTSAYRRRRRAHRDRHRGPAANRPRAAPGPAPDRAAGRPVLPAGTAWPAAMPSVLPKPSASRSRSAADGPATGRWRWPLHRARPGHH